MPHLVPGSGASPEVKDSYTRLNKCIECGFRYYGSDTCAGDGLCSMSCPMGINVADMTHELRGQQLPGYAHYLGEFAANNFSGVKASLKGVLILARIGHRILGTDAMTSISKDLHKCGLPLWTPSMSHAYKVKSDVREDGDRPLKVVYFPSCLNQTMGVDKSSEGLSPLAEEMMDLFGKAGYEVIFPEGMGSLCCGFACDKGMTHPELSRFALRKLPAQIEEQGIETGYSNSRSAK